MINRVVGHFVFAFGTLVLMNTLGCSRHVAYVHDATFGIDINFTSDGTSHFVLGYDNETFAVVPKFNIPTGAGTTQPMTQAMTLVSVSNVSADGLDDIVFNHVVATGDAAPNVSKDEEGLKAMRKAIFSDETK